MSMLNFFNKSLLFSELIEQSKDNNGNSSSKFTLPLHLTTSSDINNFFE